MVQREQTMTTKYVGLFILFTFLAIVGFDIYLYTDDISRNSISQVIIDMTAQSPLVAWFVGLLMGGLAVHWFEEPRRENSQTDAKH